ncbi:DUF4177 domain-containing protein [Pseudoxanthomonas composti]|uniref:DUF4177 domain-containing protein n=1 Tax=Pseudoxanthomonas composti TaxID=2137479 RepID=A0A4Q1JVS9_9GAMM|nr:DUF4177 domain-containing protein [Pseudoxanthomonas composti]RXR05278.1 DUF4177 domain-containing protein [Pseudoxanthomonas composti]
MSTQPRWSYLTVEVKPGLMGGFKTDVLQHELTKHGSLGWELVQMIVSSPLAPAVLVFKRPQ